MDFWNISAYSFFLKVLTVLQTLEFTRYGITRETIHQKPVAYFKEEKAAK